MTKPSLPRSTVLPLALELVHDLNPVCTRVAVAGSLRRGRSYVGDIEIVAEVPVERGGLFGDELTPMLEPVRHVLRKHGELGKNGTRYIEVLDVDGSGVKADVFLVHPPRCATCGFKIEEPNDAPNDAGGEVVRDIRRDLQSEGRQPPREPRGGRQGEAVRSRDLPALRGRLPGPLTACPDCGGQSFVGSSWGTILAIRTGPSELSQWAVTRMRRLSRRCVDGHVETKDGERIPTPTEEDFFRAAGLDCLAPEERESREARLPAEVGT